LPSNINYAIVCDHRNAQQRSSNASQPAAADDGDDYLTPKETGQSEEPQYEDIELDHKHHGPDADHYGSLNPQTQGEQPQYDVISPPQKAKDAPDYDYVM